MVQVQVQVVAAAEEEVAVEAEVGRREGGTCKKNSSVTRIAHFFAIGKGLSTLEVSAHFIKISISNCLSMPAR